MKQIGLACHNFHDAFGFMPGGVQSYNTTVPNERTNPGTWLRRILPYVEQNKQKQPGNRNLPTSVCPSDPRGSVTYAGSGGFGNYGLSWYVATDFQRYGDGRGMIAGSDIYKTDSTVFFYEPQRISLVSVTDGTTNTVMISERLPSIAGSYSDLFWGWWDFPTTYDTRSPARARSGLYFSSGSGSGNVACVYPAPMMAGTIRNQCAFNAPSSFHTGGANFTMGDASVRFVSIAGANATFVNGATTMTILEAMGSRDGGETFTLQ